MARQLAVWIAAIVFFVLGSVWYTVFSTRWLAAIGKTMDQIGFIAILVMCYSLAWLIERLQATTFTGGMRIGALVATGFIVANLALNYGFEWRPVALWLINGVYAVVGLALAGAIIGGWKRRA